MMRLARLDLVRFGHFSDHTLDLGPKDGPAFHVILGRNEAGKSTLVEAWLNLLYGIPLNTSYAFRHPRNTLEIRAVVDDGAGPVALTRTAQRTNDLLDATGAPVPPAAMTSILRGVSDEAYRALWCLDDATIERGGDDILASRGDLGRLLFAAASGLEAFNADLEREHAADQSFQRRGPGRQSTDMFRLKKDLDALKTARDELDVTAPVHRRLRTAAAEAAAGEADARTRHADLKQHEAGLRARLTALPLKADLDDLAGRLAPLGDPPAIGDGAAAEIAELARQRTAHQSTLRARRADLVRLSGEFEAIVVDAAAGDLAGRLAGVSDLRNRAANGAKDLPGRRDEADRRRRTAARVLADLGLAGMDPADVRLPGPALEALDRAVQAQGLAALAVDQARAEHVRAVAAQAAARDEAAATGVTGRDGAATDGAAPDGAAPDGVATDGAATDGAVPDGMADDDAAGQAARAAELRRLLDGQDARRQARALADAVRTHREAAKAARSAREALAVGTTAFAACPDVVLTVDAAQALADRISDARARVERLRDRLAEDREKLARVSARASALTAQGADLSDHAAGQARARRDGLWTAHRQALTGPTADDFADALADEDALTALRLAEGARLADLRQTELDLAETRAGEAGRAAELARAEDALSAAGAELAGHLATAGLPASLGAGALAAWLTEHGRAAAAERAERAAAGALADLSRRTAPLWQALSAALTAVPGGTGGAVADDDPDALVHAAGTTLTGLEAEAERRRRALGAVAAAADALAGRAAELDAATGSLAAADDALAAAAGALELALPDDLDLSDALPLLRELASECIGLADLSDRIAKMEADARAFAGAIARIAAPWPDVAPLPPLAQADALDRIAAEAVKSGDRRARLADEIARAEREIEATGRDLARIDDDARRLAAVFPEPPTEFQEICDAVGRAAEAGRLRGEIRKAGLRLAALLGTATADQGRAMLDGVTEADLQAQLDVLAPDLTAAEAARDQAIRARVLADEALKRIGAGDDVARLAQQRQTVLENLRERTELGLVRRLALMLSERALARYRDRHRSAMLADTARTFDDLTGGAYPKLATQQTDRGDVLIAHRASDGSTLRADNSTMSKGTRFQLYLALRLAGYRQMAGTGTVLPFLCDDVFETFDEVRTAAACRLMHRIAGIGQALYFTHHAHVAEIARAECGAGVVIHRL